MAKKVDVDVAEETQEEQAQGFSIFDTSRKVLLAAIGAAVLAEEEITHFVNRLVERGEIAEQDARKLVKEVLDRRETIAKEKLDEIRRKRPITVATKADIEALNDKIAELSQKLEDMKSAS